MYFYILNIIYIIEVFDRWREVLIVLLKLYLYRLKEENGILIKKCLLNDGLGNL